MNARAILFILPDEGETISCAHVITLHSFCILQIERLTRI